MILTDQAFDQGDWDAARRHVEAARASPAPLPELLPGLCYTEAVLARMRGDRGTRERAARRVIDSDSTLLAPSGWNIPARELLEEHAERQGLTRFAGARG